jgi:hypothetical protein
VANYLLPGLLLPIQNGGCNLESCIERPKELARQKKISEAFVEGRTGTVLEVAYRSAQGVSVKLVISGRGSS